MSTDRFDTSDKIASEMAGEMAAEAAVETSFDTDSEQAATLSCPHCHKRYAVEPHRILASAQPPKFRCVECGTVFIATARATDGTISIDTIEALAPERRPTSAPAPTAGSAAPIRDGRVCPKCETLNPRQAQECSGCGLIFARYRPQDEPADERLTANRSLADQWERLLEVYPDENAHHEFILACSKASALAFAAQKYGRILEVSPQEPTARQMSARVASLASLPITKTIERSPTKPRSLWLHNFVIFLGSAGITAGLIEPSFAPLAAAGASLLLVGFGWRKYIG